MPGARTFGDWVWTFVGLAGVVCIGIAVYMFLPRSESPEDIRKSVEEHFRQGGELLKSGDAEAAVEELTLAAQKENGTNPFVLNLLGEALLATGKTDMAARQWFSALSLHPLFPRPYENLAEWLEKRGEVVAAASFYRTARALYIEEVPEGLDERRRKATIESADELEKTLDKARKDYAANPANPDALMFLLLHTLADLHVSDDAAPAEALELAVTTLGSTFEDLDARIDKQRSACKDRAESVVDRAGLGLLLLLAGDPNAKTTVDEAFALSSADPAALFGASLVDLFTGAKEFTRIEQAANRMNRHPVPWLVLGAAAIAADRKDVAKTAMGNVLRLQPLSPAFPAIPEVYRLHALTLTEKEQAEEKARFLKAYSRFFD